VALGDEPGAVEGMDGSLEPASLADLKEVLSADKQATFREPKGRVRARYSVLTRCGGTVKRALEHSSQMKRKVATLGMARRR